MATPAQGLARLREAADAGELDALCARHAVRVLTVFGSAVRAPDRARDLDVAVFSEPDAAFDPIALITDLVALTGVEEIDLAHLNRGGPVLRERALVGSIPLFESAPGRFADAQVAAIGERIETDPVRRLDLELLAAPRYVGPVEAPSSTVTPRAVDWRSLRAKLRRMRELLDQLVVLGPVDPERLAAEPLTALAVERILTLLVDLAFASNSHVAVGLLGRAPDTYAESFALAAEAGMIDGELAAVLRPSVGMRNVLVHNYLDADQARVALAVPLAVEQYGDYVRQVATFLQGRT